LIISRASMTPKTRPVKVRPLDATPLPCYLASRFAAHPICGVLAVTGGRAKCCFAFDGDVASQALPALENMEPISAFSWPTDAFFRSAIRSMRQRPEFVLNTLLNKQITNE
jgi:hypothetical protein